MKIISELNKIMAGAITISVYRNGDISIKEISVSNPVIPVILVLYRSDILELLMKLFT
jgi:hypothetical protein